MKIKHPFGPSGGGCRPDIEILTAPRMKRGRVLTSLLAAAIAAALPSAVLAQDQGCGGSISISTDPNTTPPNQIPFTGAPLGENVRITLTPAKGTNSLDLLINEVDYALTCANNNDAVPCANGNDAAASGGAPIAFGGNVGGTCGATDATTTDNGDGTINFAFTPQTLGVTGCTVEFDVTVNDKGTDASPLILTGAAASTTGTCGTNGLNGAARGSVAIFLESVPEINIVKEISIDGGTTWSDANTEGAAPVVPFPSDALYRFTVENTGTAPLIDITVEDADLGIAATAIANLAPGETVVIGSDSAGFEALAVLDRCTNAGVFANTATAAGTSGDDATVVVMDTDPAVLVCVGTPDIEILKEITTDGGTTWFDANDAPGAPQAEFPSDAGYRLTVTNTGTTDLVNVTVNDPTLGIVDFLIGNLAQDEVVILAQSDIAELFVQDRCTNSGEFFNTASVSGDSEQPIQTVNDSDIAVLVCVGDPMIDLLKEISIDGGTTWFDANDVGTAPTAVWPSDASYRVTVTNIGTAPLVNITVSDADLGIPATVVPDLNPGDEHVITSGIAGFEALFALDRCTNSGTFFNTAETSGQSAETAEVVTAGDPATLVCVGEPDIDLLKEISIDAGTTWFDANDAGSAPTASAPSDADYRITVTNTGTSDLENITVSDPTLGLVDVMIDNLAVGESVVLDSGSLGFEALHMAGRCTTAGEFANNASTQGDSVETGETVSDSDPAVLLCELQLAEICRTPGFWSTHAGVEKKNSTNLTQLVIDAAGGSLSICGTTIDNTNVGSEFSALEAMCVSPQGNQLLQLTRQLTAMALNCVASGGNADCSGTSVESLFQAANEACASGVANASDYISAVDAFNNGVDSDCHERDLSESDVFEGVAKLPGSAGSSKTCNDARRNDVIVLP